MDIERKLLLEKAQMIRTRGYIYNGPVKSLTGLFRIPKVVSEDVMDSRIVYDATMCGLNQAMWAPNFYLPTIDDALRIVDSASWF